MVEALLFGIIQGLSEFLPISSSGHLALAMHLTGWSEPPMVMSLIVHLGTLAAVFAVYGRDLLRAAGGALRLVPALFRGQARALVSEEAEVRLALWIVVATLPTGVVALLLRSLVEQVTESPQVIGLCLVVGGLVLLVSRWFPAGHAPLNGWRAALVGLAQGVAVFPGISRSGTTIVAGMALGLPREEAARFSFVASVPAIIGASLLEIDPSVVANDSGSAFRYLAAGFSAMVVGYLALKVLIGLVRRGNLWWFSFYVLPVGILAFFFVR